MAELILGWLGPERIRSFVTTSIQPNIIKVEFAIKMTLHTHQTQTQCQQYLNCYSPDFNETLMVGFWDQQQLQQQQQQ